MPSGCEFTCDNEECEQYRAGFIVNGPWPIGNICLIMNASNIRHNKSFRDGLIKLKDDGVKHACITMPNNEDIPVLGYRVQNWCSQCTCIWNNDLALEFSEQTFEEALENSDFNDFKCPKCSGDTMTYDQIVEEGIQCPFCDVKMSQSTWFSNEQEERVRESKKESKDAEVN